MPDDHTILFERRKAKAFRKGRNKPIRNIVLHSTDGRESGDIETLTGAKVSVHWYVTRRAKIYHFVDDADTAFHAGAVFEPSQFGNDATVGIEQEHFDPDPDHGRPNNEDWPPDQIEAVARLTAFLLQQHGLKIDNIQTHAEIAKPKGRKQDPFGYPMAMFKSLVTANLQFIWKAQEL